MLLEFLNLGGGEILILLAIILVQVIIIVYSVINIIQSTFKSAIYKPIFLLMVFFLPFIGSLVYLFLRKDYLKPTEHAQFPEQSGLTLKL